MKSGVCIHVCRCICVYRCICKHAYVLMEPRNQLWVSFFMNFPPFFLKQDLSLGPGTSC